VPLREVIIAVSRAELVQLDPGDATASPILIKAPFNLRIDWWKDGDAVFSGLKVWAGTMESFRIARAMQLTMRQAVLQSSDLFNVGLIAYDSDDPSKKVEPYYFDARRGPNAHSRDIGFSPNDLGMTTTAFPAVELLCLIGLQRCKPLPTPHPRVYDYHLWVRPIGPVLLPPAVAGLLQPSLGYEFESGFRTGQKKHKAFLRAKQKP
jgi:CRISPR-associated protein Csb3